MVISLFPYVSCVTITLPCLIRGANYRSVMCLGWGPNSSTGSLAILQEMVGSDGAFPIARSSSSDHAHRFLWVFIALVSYLILEMPLILVVFPNSLSFHLPPAWSFLLLNPYPHADTPYPPVILFPFTVRFLPPPTLELSLIFGFFWPVDFSIAIFHS